MDPLSNIIGLLHPHDCVAAGFDAAGNWSIQFDGHAGLKCNAVIKGTCWITVAGEDPVYMEEGDCVILPKGLPFVLSAKPNRAGTDAQLFYRPVRHGGTAVYNGGGEFLMSGARFLLEGQLAEPLLRGLPPLILINPGPEREAIGWTLDQISAELRSPRDGSPLSITHLSHLLLIQAMRSYLSKNDPGVSGWIGALIEPRIAPAIAAIHDDPARAWTVKDLAEIAAQSRTTFAVRFKSVTGQAPMEYLTEWRMLLAADRLSKTNLPVASIAADVGYQSESAFGVAFKRVMGQAPRKFAGSTVL